MLNQGTQRAQIVLHKMNTGIRIYGPELGSYCFSSNSDVGVVENTAENIQGKKQFARFKMLEIEERKHVYYIYIFVTLTFRTEVILVFI